MWARPGRSALEQMPNWTADFIDSLPQRDWVGRGRTGPGKAGGLAARPVEHRLHYRLGYRSRPTPCIRVPRRRRRLCILPSKLTGSPTSSPSRGQQQPVCPESLLVRTPSSSPCLERTPRLARRQSQSRPQPAPYGLLPDRSAPFVAEPAASLANSTVLSRHDRSVRANCPSQRRRFKSRAAYWCTCGLCPGLRRVRWAGPFFTCTSKATGIVFGG